MQTLIKQTNKKIIGFKHISVRRNMVQKKKTLRKPHTWNPSGKGLGDYIPTMPLIHPGYNWHKFWSENTGKM